MKRWSLVVLAIVSLLAPPAAEAEAPYAPDAASLAKAAGISIAEATRQLLERPQLDAAIAYVAAHPDDFGGIYFDRSRGGALTIALPAGNSRGRDAVAALLPAGVSVTWVTVSRPKAELHRIRDELISRSPTLDLSGTPLSFVNVDSVRNVVVLGLEGPITEVSADVSREFGEAVEVVSARRAQPVACTDRVFCTPWRGGIKIWSDDGKRCSYGYNARSTSSATRYMITAGHCYNATWKHFGVVIGTTGFNNLDANSSGTALGDFQRVPSSALETPRNLVYASDSDKSRQITSRRPYTGQVYGDLACAAGFMSGYRCGFIRDDDNWICINHNGTKCYWAKRGGDAASPMQSIEGDSGGPVFVDGVALGIVAAVDAINFPYSSYWSTMDNGESALGVTLCFTSAC